MTRLWPESLAGRTILVLIAGLLLALLASILTLVSLDRLLGQEPLRYPRLIERMATVATIVNRVPPEARPALAAELSRPRVEVAWRAHAGPPAQARADWRTRRLERDLARALAGGTVVRVDQDRERTEVWIGLRDGSWLTLAFERDWFGPLWLLRFVLALVVLTGGIAGLAVWAARRVTVPLSRSAGAAAELGADVTVPPLDERGPVEVRRAAHAFNQMQARIRRLVDDRTHMLAAIAHDLRTVLTRLRLRVELIEDEEQQRKAVADLEAMRVMLDETLAFARDEAGGEARTDLDLAALLQSLCADLTDAGARARYAGPDHLVCAGRPVALGRAFANLVDNALRYGGEAEVGLGARDGEVEVTVADCGPGIPPERREQVFQPFFRLEPSRSRETGGTGLGLALARSIVRRHGGEITFDDRACGGLLVRVTLPRGR